MSPWPPCPFSCGPTNVSLCRLFPPWPRVAAWLHEISLRVPPAPEQQHTGFLLFTPASRITHTAATQQTTDVPHLHMELYCSWCVQSQTPVRANDKEIGRYYSCLHRTLSGNLCWRPRGDLTLMFERLARTLLSIILRIQQSYLTHSLVSTLWELCLES